MEKQVQHQLASAQQETESESEGSASASAPLLAQELAKQQHPMGKISDWAKDFAAFGAISGFVMAAFLTLALSEGVALLIFLPMIMAIQGVVVGLVTGGVLRALRGKISAALGVVVTTFAGLLASTIPGLVFGQGMFEPSRLIRGLPLTLSVLVLIPLLSVLRSQEKSTTRWILLFGVIVGAMLGPLSVMVGT